MSISTKLANHSNEKRINPSTAKGGGGGKITLQSTFLPITQTTRPTAKIPLVTFPEYVFCTEWW